MSALYDKLLREQAIAVRLSSERPIKPGGLRPWTDVEVIAIRQAEDARKNAA